MLECILFETGNVGVNSVQAQVIFWELHETFGKQRQDILTKYKHHLEQLPRRQEEIRKEMLAELKQIKDNKRIETEVAKYVNLLKNYKESGTKTFNWNYRPKGKSKGKSQSKKKPKKKKTAL